MPHRSANETESILQNHSDRTPPDARDHHQSTPQDDGEDQLSSHPGLSIAIIGMAGRFPGATDLETYWQNLCRGVESITPLSDDMLEKEGVPLEVRGSPRYVKAAPILEDVECFDAPLFGYTALEARLLAPEQRLLLECAWEALESAGYPPGITTDPVGVVAGARLSTYLFHLTAHQDLIPPEARLLVELGNDPGMAASRLAYKLDLRGPAYSVSTACSTSLTALHLACQSLLLGECRMALAGAAAVMVPHRVGYLFEPDSMLSPDGHVRPFDAQAQGTVFGSGAGVVVLKHLTDAQRDGDNILAVIRGSATNNDGSQKASYTAPSVEGQTEVLLEALACAGVTADQVSYLEAHATGTILGDPIELLAATNAWRASTDRRGFCQIGSVKGNLGHLDAAAGMAGLIKTVLALRHQKIPPTLHFSTPNPQIDFASSPFVVTTRLQDWPGPAPRLAAVSSFGFGGTNAHIILEEYPQERALKAASPGWQLLPLSARTPEALEAATDRLADWLEARPELRLEEVAYTLQCGRKPLPYRRIVTAESLESATSRLRKREPGRVFSHLMSRAEPPIAFLFPGQGAQQVNMARDLFERPGVFRDVVQECLTILHPLLPSPLASILYPMAGDEALASQQLRQTAFTQPALFVVSYALARQWQTWGVMPSILLGHSLGEYVAACLAGVFSLEDALRLVSARGRLMQTLPGGAMLSVSMTEQALLPWLEEFALDLAAVNGPESCVVSGQEDAISRLQTRLEGLGLAPRRLNTSHAFHSRMLDPILERFQKLVSSLELSPPTCPLISNLTGRLLTDAEATQPSYWVEQLRRPVRFADGVALLMQDPAQLVLEVGPGHTLIRLSQLQPVSRQRCLLASLPARGEKAELEQLLSTAGQLWSHGTPLDWPALHGELPPRRVALPTYPFEKQRHWLDAPPSAATPAPRAGLENLQLDSIPRQPIQRWLHHPGWKQRPLVRRSGSPRPQAFLIFSDQDGPGCQLSTSLREAGHSVTEVFPDAEFGWEGPEQVRLDPSRGEDYRRLLQDLASVPTKLVWTWSLQAHQHNALVSEAVLSHQAPDSPLIFCFDGLLHLAQALGERPAEARTLTVLTAGLEGPDQTPLSAPLQALSLGPLRVIPREFKHLCCRQVDLPCPDGQTSPRILERLVQEVTSSAQEPAVALREHMRYCAQLEALELDPEDRQDPPTDADNVLILKETQASTANELSTPFRPRGRYLITGGLGWLGLNLGEFLARTCQARLLLVGRTGLPPREAWDSWLATHDSSDVTSGRLTRLMAMERHGAALWIEALDVENGPALARLVALAQERWGGLDGVIHAAGQPGGSLILRWEPTRALNVLAPKVLGARNLERALRPLVEDNSLDFLIYFSSMAAIVGDVGQADYCAANAFLDAHARHLRNQGWPAFSINWDMWAGGGFSQPALLPEALQQLRQKQLAVAIQPAEGMAVLSTVLGQTESAQVLVSPVDPSWILSRMESLSRGNLLDQLGQPVVHENLQPRPEQLGPYLPPENDLERGLADIFQTLLGVSPISRSDSFFDLGGHSLLATQLRNQLQARFEVEVPLRAFFDQPTVAGLGELVSRAIDLARPHETSLREQLEKAGAAQRHQVLLRWLEARASWLPDQPGETSPSARPLSGLNLTLFRAELENDLKLELDFQLFPHEVQPEGTLSDLATHILNEVERKASLTTLATALPLETWPLQSFRQQALRPRSAASKRNPSMAFLLSSPRAGSTLLRVMLAGHPQLFCPPELNLLFFDDLDQWRRNVGFGHALDWTEGGLLWAVTELLGLDSAAGQRWLDSRAQQGATVQSIYAELQTMAAPRLLIDKTPPYALDPVTLQQAEALFDQPRYLFLHRHPLPVMESILRLRLDRLFAASLFGRQDIDPFAVAEIIWQLSNQHIITFCQSIDPKRSLWVSYETLVQAPQQTMEGICAFLEVPFDARVVAPYDGKRERMLGGLGDPNIQRHQGIDSSLGEAWRHIRWPRDLHPRTVDLARQLGYTMGTIEAEPVVAQSIPEEVEDLEAFVGGLSDEEVARMLAELEGDAP